jgi:hypothetical protein
MRDIRAVKLPRSLHCAFNEGISDIRVRFIHICGPSYSSSHVSCDTVHSML